MEFKKIQLLEYALYCLQNVVNRKNIYNNQIEFQMIIKSSEDIFRSKSLTKNKYDEFEFKNISKNNDFTSIKSDLFKTNEEDPFYELRNRINNAFKNMFLSNKFLSTDKELILPQLLQMINNIEPDHDSIDIWYDYRSEITDLRLDYNFDTSDDYKIIGLDHVVTGDK